MLESPENKRKKLMGIWAIVVVVGVVGYVGYTIAFPNLEVETDNAYVGSDTAQINALASGPVSQILVLETQAVKQGDVLLKIDPSDAQIAVAQAQAGLALAQRKVDTYYAGDETLNGQLDARSAMIKSAEAQVLSAQSEAERTRLEYERRKALADTGAVSKDEMTNAQSAYVRANAALAAAQSQKLEAVAALASAKGQLDGNKVLTNGVAKDQNPEILAAKAKLDAAQLMLDRTVVRASVAGIISKKSVQVGQQVQIGTPLMSVVPLQDAYIDANYKEVQLKNVKPGQSVEVTSDLYGSGVKFHGTVVGLSGGTGSAFSLIPAQNASGNWIKVVQRLPVRIKLDANELKDHPLRVGLSMHVKINTASR